MKQFSGAAFIAYGNACINNATGKTPELQEAFRADLKRNILKAHCPREEEIDIIDTISDFDMSNTLRVIPHIVAGFMHDEDRAFELPAVDKKTAPAIIRIADVPEKTREGTIMIGDRKGETYTSTTGEHKEYKVRSNTNAFRK